MTGPGNLYGSAPVASAPRRGGGGGNTNRPRNRNQGNGGGGGGGNNTPNGGLYGGDQGDALTNQDPEQYIQDLLGQLGVLDSSGSQYGTWRNSNMAATLLSGYRQAHDFDQSLNPADYFKNTYGTGFGNGPGKHNQGSVFNAGTLGGITGPSSDQYQDFLSTDDPGNFMLGKFGQAGLTMPGGGNADFDRYLTNVYAPKVQANLDAARAAGAVSTDGNLVSIPGAAGGGSGSTLPFGSSGDFGGDPMNRRAWLHDQGLHRLGQMNANSRHNAKGQYQDYLSGFGNGGGGGATDPATSGAPSTIPITLNDFLATQNLDQARQMYAFRSNAERQPSPLQLAGRWSWWG